MQKTQRSFQEETRKNEKVICAMCRRLLKGVESIDRGYGPVCYRKIKPPTARKRQLAGSYNLVDDVNYNVPGQMELSDFMVIPEESKESSSGKNIMR